MKFEDVEWHPDWELHRSTNWLPYAAAVVDGTLVYVYPERGGTVFWVAASRKGYVDGVEVSPLQGLVLAAMSPGEVYQWLIGRAGGDTT